MTGAGRRATAGGMLAAPALVAVSIVAVSILVLSIAGCVPASSADVRPTTVRPLVAITHPQIVQYCADVDAVHFDGDVDAVDRVYVCVARTLEPDEESYPGTRQQAFRVHDVDALLAAYSAPDAAEPDAACDQPLVDPLTVWLWEGGDRMAIRAPIDGCGFPTEAAAAAYRSADRTLVQEARERIDG